MVLFIHETHLFKDQAASIFCFQNYAAKADINKNGERLKKGQQNKKDEVVPGIRRHCPVLNKDGADVYYCPSCDFTKHNEETEPDEGYFTSYLTKWFPKDEDGNIEWDKPKSHWNDHFKVLIASGNIKKKNGEPHSMASLSTALSGEKRKLESHFSSQMSWCMGKLPACFESSKNIKATRKKADS